MSSFKQNPFLKNKLAVLSAVFLLLITVLAIFAPQVTPFPYDEQHIEDRLQSPNSKYIMGSDSLGRDLYTRIIFGARASIAVGITTALLSLVVGIIYGAAAGHFGGLIDGVMMRVLDAFYIFPSLLFAILLMIVITRYLGNSLESSLLAIILSLGFSSWVNVARLVRGEVLKISQLPHVEAARALGVGSVQLIAKHIVPLTLGPLIVTLTIQVPQNILAESFLSFIGLGLQPPFSSWGTLANEGWRAMRSYPHLILFPGVVLFLTMIAFQILGDALHDWLDPRRRLF